MLHGMVMAMLTYNAYGAKDLDGFAADVNYFSSPARPDASRERDTRQAASPYMVGLLDKVGGQSEFVHQFTSSSRLLAHAVPSSARSKVASPPQASEMAAADRSQFCD